MALTDLNVECLNAVLSLKYLPISDLCSVAQCCTRLKTIANDIFKAKHKTYKIISSPDTAAETNKLLFNFGSLITELSIETRSWCDETTIASVIRYCKGTLETFGLEHYGVPVHQTARLRVFFTKLKKLYLNDIYIKGTEDEEEGSLDKWSDLKTLLPELENFLGHCKSLVELKVHDCENIKALVFESTFPQLEHFKNDFLDDEIGRCKLGKFVLRHKNLKTFKLSTDEDCIFLLPIIAATCTQLENLHFNATTPYETSFVDALMSILSLQNLKKLKLSCSFKNVTRFIEGLHYTESLEKLDLSHVRGDTKLIQALSQLKKLRVLRLEGCDPIEDINLLGELSELEELIIENYERDEVKFDVVSLIQRLENLKRLQLQIWDGFKMCKSKYLKILAIAQGRLTKSQCQHTLQILCATEVGLIDSCEYKINSHIVKLSY